MSHQGDQRGVPGETAYLPPNPASQTLEFSRSIYAATAVATRGKGSHP